MKNRTPSHRLWSTPFVKGRSGWDALSDRSRQEACLLGHSCRWCPSQTCSEALHCGVTRLPRCPTKFLSSWSESFNLQRLLNTTYTLEIKLIGYWYLHDVGRFLALRSTFLNLHWLFIFVCLMFSEQGTNDFRSIEFFSWMIYATYFTNWTIHIAMTNF